MDLREQPVETIQIRKKLIILDSRDRDFSKYAEPNNYRATLPDVYRKIFRMRLVSYEIPNSFYTFDASLSNVTFDISYGSSISTITIPNGNYTPTTLANKIDALLDGLTGDPFIVSVDPATNKMTISNDTTPFSINFDVTSTTDMNTEWGLGYYMGFKKQSYTASLVGSDYVLTSDYPVNTDPWKYILMEIDTMNDLDELPLEGRKSGSRKAAFAKIIMQNGKWEYEFGNEQTSLHNDFIFDPPREKLGSLMIQFRLHDGRAVNFNHMDHSLTLELDYEL
jgi:hypothetical protein